jgi:hypothetical protein
MQMKWNDIFQNPAEVGQSEYGAIHECITGAIFDGPTDFPADTELGDEHVEMVIGMLNEFREWSNALLVRFTTLSGVSSAQLDKIEGLVEEGAETADTPADLSGGPVPAPDQLSDAEPEPVSDEEPYVYTGEGPFAPEEISADIMVITVVANDIAKLQGPMAKNIGFAARKQFGMGNAGIERHSGPFPITKDFEPDETLKQGHERYDGYAVRFKLTRGL